MEISVTSANNGKTLMNHLVNSRGICADIWANEQVQGWMVKSVRPAVGWPADRQTGHEGGHCSLLNESNLQIEPAKGFFLFKMK